MKKSITVLCMLLALTLLAGCEEKTPEPPALKAIALDKTELTLKAGETAELNVTADPADYPDLKVTWTSSDEKVATVKDGKVTAVSGGSAKITAEAEGKKAECTVTVPESTQKALFKLLEGRTDKYYSLQRDKGGKKAYLFSKVEMPDQYFFILETENGLFSAESGEIEKVDSKVVWDSPLVKCTVTPIPETAGDEKVDITYTPEGKAEEKFCFDASKVYTFLYPKEELRKNDLMLVLGDYSETTGKQVMYMLSHDNIYDLVVDPANYQMKIMYLPKEGEPVYVGDLTPITERMISFVINGPNKDEKITFINPGV